MSLNVSYFLFLGGERSLTFASRLDLGVVGLRSTLGRGAYLLVGLAIILVLISGGLLNLCLSGFHYDVDYC